MGDLRLACKRGVWPTFAWGGAVGFTTFSGRTLGVRLGFLIAMATIVASAQAVAQNKPGGFGEPQDMRWQVPFESQTTMAPAGKLAPDPVQAPAGAIYNVPGPTTSSSTPLVLNNNLKDIVTLAPTTPAANASSSSSYPQSAPIYTAPNNQTFNNDGKTTAAPPAKAVTAPQLSATTSGPSVKAATTSVPTIAGFGITTQDVVTIRTASATPAATPISTNVWDAIGKPNKFVPVPTFSNALTNLRRVPQTYVPANDGSAEVAHLLGVFLLGVAQGYASSGGGFSGSGGGGTFHGSSVRPGGPCAYWTTNVAACRAVR